VLDMQDPWVTDYYDRHPGVAPPRKYAAARRLHALLEPWTMRDVDGIVSVSPAYVEDLRRRYPRLRDRPCSIVPFGVSSADLQFVEQRPQPNRAFRRGDGLWHAAFTGAAGDYMAPALEHLFRALRRGLEMAPREFERVRLHFVGTGYDESASSRTVTAAAVACGVDRYVEEIAARVPYFEALQIVRDADCLVIVGSDDPAYNASKLNLYLVAGKPLLAVIHEASVMRAPLEQASAVCSTFHSGAPPPSDAIARLTDAWHALLVSRTDAPARRSVEPFTATEGTRQQCALFDRVLVNRATAAAAA
jgi:hypothetical protein